MLFSSSQWLAISAALLPSATAFYPYQYGDDGASKTTRDVSPRSNSNTRPLTLPLRRVSAPLQGRQNAYNIVKSKAPTQANSVAIDQDGGDLSYMVALTIGDSKEEYHLLLDSAASNTWVMGQDCATDACKMHTTFGQGDSTSLKTQNTPFSITYGTGSVSGTLATDVLHIGALSPTLTFGLATNVSSEFSSYPMDGILGIGRGVKVSGSIAAPQVMDVLSTSKLISSKLYAIHLSRAKDGLQDGELNLGAINKNRYSGDLNWLPTIANDNGFWEVGVDGAAVDGKNFALSGPRSAIIDTGTSFILMPESDAKALHALIPGSKQDGETFSVPCDTAAVVQFVFNKVTYNITTPDWRGGRLPSGLCRSNVVGRQTFKPTQWLVGDVFLKNVYSVYDFDAGRLGFGVKAADAGSSPSSSAAAAAASSSALSSGSPGPSSSARVSPALDGRPAASTGLPPASTSASGSPQGQNGAQGSAAGRTVVSRMLLLLCLFAGVGWLV